MWRIKKETPVSDMWVFFLSLFFFLKAVTFVLGACFLLLALREASYHVLSQGETRVQWAKGGLQPVGRWGSVEMVPGALEPSGEATTGGGILIAALWEALKEPSSATSWLLPHRECNTVCFCYFELPPVVAAIVNKYIPLPSALLMGLTKVQFFVFFSFF